MHGQVHFQSSLDADAEAHPIMTNGWLGFGLEQ